MVELADSSPESADSTTDFVIVGQLPVLNIFDTSTPIQSADSSQPTIAGMGHNLNLYVYQCNLYGRRGLLGVDVCMKMTFCM